MLRVPQTHKYPPEENQQSRKKHMGVKEQAALSGIAHRGRCEAWPSFFI